MKIPRENLQKDLESFIFSGSGVVIGTPGAGKSYALRALSAKLIADKHPCLFIPVDKLGPLEREQDLRTELGYSGDLIPYLKEQKTLLKAVTGRPGIIIIDAFDAARSEVSQQLLIRIIKGVRTALAGEWNVLVSVRTYDARKSIELQEIFPIAEKDTAVSIHPEIICRHFNIPLLSDPEVTDAVSRNGLKDAYDKSSTQLRSLLKIPFNLWLLCRLVELGLDINQLTKIRSEVELLGLFWRYRVDGADGASRELLLADISKKMVESKSLSIRKDSLSRPVESSTWKALLSTEVLAETSDTQRVFFSHNILFDYAVSLLLIEDSFEKFSEFLAADKSRILFLRPSLHYYFVRRWYNSPTDFWDMFWKLLKSSEPRLRLAARLLPSRIVAEEVLRIEECRPVLDLLQKDEIAVDAILGILEAIRALGLHRHHLWAEFLLECSKTPHRKFAGEIAGLAASVLEYAQKNKDKSLVDLVGQTGRNLQTWIWAERKKGRDPFLENLGAQWGVRIVARTYGTNPEESRALLAPILELPKEVNFPIDYLYRLTHELKSVLPYDAEFIHETYLTVFRNNEMSEDKTSMGTPVVAMTSTRRQDYSMCRYSLVEIFPEYMKAHPVIATKTYIGCIDAFIAAKHIHLKEGVRIEDAIKTFPFLGGAAHLLRDGSAIWDQGYRDDQLKMADSFFEFIEKEAPRLHGENTLRLIVEQFRDHAIAAFHWRHLLASAAKQPAPYIDLLHELCLSRPIQTSSETIRELGLYIEASTPQSSAYKREEIEKSILSLTDSL